MTRKDYAFTADSAQASTHDEQMYSGALSFCRRKYARDLNGADVAIIGVPFDNAVTNRPGTRLGPRGIRAASVNLAWSRAWPSKIDPFEAMSVVDWGDIALDPHKPGEVTEQIRAPIAAAIDGNRRALMLGGDHYTTYPSLQAHAEKYGPLALVQFDAHSDTWPDDGDRIDHGTMFYHGIKQGLIDPNRSIQIGIRTTNDDPCGVETRDAITVHETPLAETIAAIKNRVGDHPVYLSFDIDALDPAFAPGTGTPVVGGLSTHQAMQILRGLEGLKLIGADVVEVSPPFDHAEITALAGASIALQLLCLMAASHDT